MSQREEHQVFQPRGLPERAIERVSLEVSLSTVYRALRSKLWVICSLWQLVFYLLSSDIIGRLGLFTWDLRLKTGYLLRIDT